jgi:uncharacterized protein YndB with AHSA1/START domain
MARRYRPMMAFEADGEAPVFAQSEVEISASPSEVWEVMADIDEWPKWNPDIKSAELNGPLEEGSTFRWKSGPGTITSRLQHVERPRRIAWSGKTLGISAKHVWELEETEDGTLVRTLESWEGLPARLFRKSSQRTVETALRDGPGHLKKAVEARSGDARSEP